MSCAIYAIFPPRFLHDCESDIHCEHRLPHLPQGTNAAVMLRVRRRVAPPGEIEVVVVGRESLARQEALRPARAGHYLQKNETLAMVTKGAFLVVAPS